MKVCIDPGHGMGNVTPGKYDPGCTHGTLTEAEIALQWGLTLKHVLIGMGHEVFMTRDDATDHTPVGRRDDRAEAEGCDVFLSIHVNAAGPPGYEAARSWLEGRGAIPSREAGSVRVRSKEPGGAYRDRLHWERKGPECDA